MSIIHAGAVWHTFSERISGSSQEVHLEESATGAENELTWPPRVQPPGLSSSPIRPHAPRVHAVVAGAGPLLSPARPGGGRHRVAAAVLAGHWLRFRQLVPLGQRRRTAALSGLLLSRRAHHDRAVHFDLHHDVGDRRSQRGISALGAGRPGAALGHRAGQSAGRNHAVGHSGTDLSGFCAAGRRAHQLDRFPAGRA